MNEESLRNKRDYNCVLTAKRGNGSYLLVSGSWNNGEGKGLIASEAGSSVRGNLSSPFSDIALPVYFTPPYEVALMVYVKNVKVCQVFTVVY